MATTRDLLHQRVQSRLQHVAPKRRHSRRSAVVQNDTARRVLFRRHSARRLVHGHRLPDLGNRATVRLERDDRHPDEQRRRHLARGRERRVEFRLADGSASRGADAPAVEQRGHRCHDRDGRRVRFLGLPSWYLQYELSGPRTE